MKRSTIEENAKRLLREFVRDLRLQDWTITLTVESLDDDEVAGVDVLPEYRRAAIQIDADRNRSVADISRSVYHECLHIVTADFQLFWQIAKEGLSGSELKKLDQAFDQHWEMMIQRLERLK